MADEPHSTELGKTFKYYANLADVDFLYTLRHGERPPLEQAASARNAFSGEATVVIPSMVLRVVNSARHPVPDFVVGSVRPRHNLVQGEDYLEAMDATYECSKCGKLSQEGHAKGCNGKT